MRSSEAEARCGPKEQRRGAAQNVFLKLKINTNLGKFEIKWPKSAKKTENWGRLGFSTLNGLGVLVDPCPLRNFILAAPLRARHTIYFSATAIAKYTVTC